MKQFIYFFVFIITSTFAVAQEMPQDAPLTSITFDSTTMDYGVIPAGANGVRSFKFKNSGSNTLYIYNIFSSPHLKVLSQPKDGIAPGEEAEIKVEYNTSIKGKIVKTLTVKANTKEGIVPLSVTGTVK